jgi:transcriptional regulator with XRE-family HTH domain
VCIMQNSKDQQQMSVAKARGKRLKRLRNLANLSRQHAAQRYGININTLKGWEIGRHGGLTSKGAKKIISMLKDYGMLCESSWLLDGEGAPPVMYERSVFDTSTVIELKQEIPIDEYKQIQAEFALFAAQSPAAVLYKVIDQTMAPLYRQGEYAAGIRCYGNDINALVGVACIVETIAGDVSLRCLKAQLQPGLYSLLALNASADLQQTDQYDVQLQSAAAVVWQRRINQVQVCQTQAKD